MCALCWMRLLRKAMRWNQPFCFTTMNLHNVTLILSLLLVQGSSMLSLQKPFSNQKQFSVGSLQRS
jgi:hypothetical protein